MHDTPRLAARFSLASAVLFLLLVVLQLTTGTSQHFFELVHPPDAYAQALVEHGPWLRGIIALDDVFIALYLSSTALVALALPPHPLRWPVVGLVAAAGLLDLEENHHLLAMLEAARAGLTPSLAELVRRMDLSSVKWALAHVGFLGFAFVVPGTRPLARAFRAFGIWVAMPVGLFGVVYGELRWLTLLRALDLFAGFLVLAALAAGRAPSRSAAGSGAPASPPGTTPATAG